MVFCHPSRSSLCMITLRNQSPRQAPAANIQSSIGPFVNPLGTPRLPLQKIREIEKKRGTGTMFSSHPKDKFHWPSIFLEDSFCSYQRAFPPRITWFPCVHSAHCYPETPPNPKAPRLQLASWKHHKANLSYFSHRGSFGKGHLSLPYNLSPSLLSVGPSLLFFVFFSPHERELLGLRLNPCECL